MEFQEPISLFQELLREASSKEPMEGTACALATADLSGQPSVRFVLLKSVGSNGFVFFTNHVSRKGRELAENPRAALAFYWPSLGRQVRVEGVTTRLLRDENDAYFSTRPRGSQIGAWASRQSAPIASRQALEKRVTEIEEKFAGATVPCPEFCGGYRLKPEKIEFWNEQSNRLHDRRVYVATRTGWDTLILCP